MIDCTISPVFWSVDQLVSFGDDAIYDLALSAAGTKTSNNLLLGRCLLAVDRSKLYERFALSGAVHFAVSVLGMSEKEACTVRRVARELQELPLLNQAAQNGTVGWSKLREVVSVATSETEELWLELCGKLRWKEIQKLVGLTPKGGVPGTCPGGVAARHGEEYRCRFASEVVTVIERVLRQRSRVEGKPISFAEVVEQLFLEALATEPDDAAAEKAREEARLEMMADRLSLEPLVQQAIELAKGLGLLEQVDGEVTNSVATEPAKVSKRVLERGAGSDEIVTAEGKAPERPEEPAPSRAGRDAEGRLGSEGDEVGSERVSLDREEAPQAAGPSRAGPDVEGVRVGEGGHTGNWRDRCCADRKKSLADLLLSHLRFNSQQRRLTAAQRKALLRRDRHCCQTPGCPHHLWLHIHHLKWFCLGGETTPENLITLCTRCHRNIHEGRLHISRADNGELIFTNPQRGGQRLDFGHRLERATWLDYHVGWRGKPSDSYHFRSLQELGLEMFAEAA